MKKIISLAFLFLILTACTTMQSFSTADMTPEGVRFKYGSSRGIKLGDKIIAYKKIPSSSKRGYSFAPLGTLTVAKVDHDFSILKKDGDFEVGESTSFMKE